MSDPRYEIRKDSSGDFRFNLKAANNEIILSSSEGYVNKSDCRNAIGICQRNAPGDAFYDRRTASDGSFYFTLRSGNGRDIGRSETYPTVQARERGIEAVRRAGATLTVTDNT